MSPRLRYVAPIVSLCALFACQAEPTKVTSLGGGDPAPPPPALPTAEPNGEDPGQGGGVPGAASSEFVGIPIPPPASNQTEDAGQPDIETMVNENCAQTKVTAVDTTVLVPADIIIAIDTSSSMSAEVGFVQDQLNAFSEQISASGVDARVILLALPGQPGETFRDGQRNVFAVCIGAPLGSGSCPEDTNLPGYVHVPQYVDSRDALEQFIATFPEWREHLRPNSLKAFMVITDDESRMSGEAFKTELAALDPVLFERWNMNGVVSFSMCRGANNEQLAAAVGNVYRSLIEETGGVAGDLCEQNFQPVFDALASQIVENAGAELLCEWEIPPAVANQTFSTELVKVNRTTGADGGAPEATLGRVDSLANCTAGGWYFDDNYNPSRIIACESTCADMQDDANGGIAVEFGCETVEGCAANEEAVLDGDPVAMPNDDGLDDNGVGDAGAAAPPLAVACEWPLPKLDDRQQELDLESVNVRYTTSKGFGVIMGSVSDVGSCASADLGWYFDDPKKPTKIVACPETCEVLTSRQITKVNALFGCKTRPAKPRTL